MALQSRLSLRAVFGATPTTAKRLGAWQKALKMEPRRGIWCPIVDEHRLDSRSTRQVQAEIAILEILKKAWVILSPLWCRDPRPVCSHDPHPINSSLRQLGSTSTLAGWRNGILILPSTVTMEVTNGMPTSFLIANRVGMVTLASDVIRMALSRSTTTQTSIAYLALESMIRWATWTTSSNHTKVAELLTASTMMTLN